MLTTQSHESQCSASAIMPSVTRGTAMITLRTSWMLSTGRLDNSWWEAMPRGRPAMPSERVETIKEARRVACENLKALRTELKKDLLNNELGSLKARACAAFL
jgi:hypothetical protein